MEVLDDCELLKIPSMEVSVKGYMNCASSSVVVVSHGVVFIRNVTVSINE